jgi:nucleoporin p58/p45
MPPLPPNTRRGWERQRLIRTCNSGGAGSAKPPALNLFGATSGATPGATSGAPSGNLFGSSTPSTQSSNLFGATGSAAPASGGLFGSSNPSTSQAAGASNPPAFSGFSLGPAATQPASTSASAPASGLFGAAPPSQPSTGGLFGTAKPQGTGLFASNAAAASQPAAAPSFGATATSQPAASGGLFGTAPTTPAPATNIFGSAPTTRPNIPQLNLPTSSGGTANSAPSGIFGASTTQVTSAGPNPFGASTTASSAPAAGGLFAPQPASALVATPSAIPTPATAAQTATGLFGSANASSQPTAAAPSGFGGFGAAAQIKPAPATGASAAPASLFGALGTTGTNVPAGSTATPSGFQGFGAQSTSAALPTQLGQPPDPRPLFSSLGVGGGLGTNPSSNSINPQQTVVPTSKITTFDNIKSTTRFFELHEDIQRQLEQIDLFIQTQSGFFGQVSAFTPGHSEQLKTISPDVEFVKNKLDTVEQGLEQDAAEVSAIAGVVSKDVEDAEREYAAIQQLNLPQQYQYHYSGAIWPPQDNAGGNSSTSPSTSFAQTDLLPYFEKRTDELAQRSSKYSNQIFEIEGHLRTVESNAVEKTERLLRLRAGQDGSKERWVELVAAMRGFEEAVFRVAEQVGGAKQGVIDCSMGSLNALSRSSRR